MSRAMKETNIEQFDGIVKLSDLWYFYASFFYYVNCAKLLLALHSELLGF